MSTPTPASPAVTGRRPLSVTHLVFGLIFLGIAAVWLLGRATGADLPRTAVGFPAVLIGAGVIGLVASLAGARRRARAEADWYAAQSVAPDVDQDVELGVELGVDQEAGQGTPAPEEER